MLCGMPDHFTFRRLRIGGVPVVVSSAYIALSIVLGYLAARAFFHLELIDTRASDAYARLVQRGEWDKLAAATLSDAHLHPTPQLAVLVGLGAVAVYTGSILAHELGHLLAARACGLHVTSIGFSATGGFVELAGDHEPTAGSLALIAAAGPLVTALLAVLGYCVRAAWPGGDGVGAGAALEMLLTLLVACNVVGLALNLLPFGPLDGARLLAAARLRYARG
jgi:Zn-dependent protease